MATERKDRSRRLNRLSRTVPIHIDQLEVKEDRPLDQVFTDLWIAHEQATLVTIRTRLPTHFVRSGTPIRNNGKVVSVWKEKLNQKYVTILSRRIRSGFRPTIPVYEVTLPNARTALMCGDDEYTLAAYRKLKISYIPVLILGRMTKSINEGRYILTGKNYASLKWEGANINSYPSIARRSDGRLKGNPEIVLRSLIAYCESTMNSIDSFHSYSDDKPSIDYHQTLHSIVFRIREALFTISELFKLGLPYQTLPLLRSIYELSLNFYLDWLSPESMGPMLQLVAQTQQISDLKIRKERTKEFSKTFGAAWRLCTNVREKATLSPMGTQFYNNTYSHLSSTVHQDFMMTEIYSGTLETGKPRKFSPENMRSVLHLLDALCGLTLQRINDDVGAAK